MNKLCLLLGAIFGLYLGWFCAINYSISVVERKKAVLSLTDWSHMKEVSEQLQKDRILFF